MNADGFAALIAGLETTGLTRTEIARRAGISRMTVWRLANGEAREPTYEVIRRVEKLHNSVGVVSPLIQKTA